MMTKNESKKKGRYHVKGTTKKGKKEGKEEEEEKGEALTLMMMVIERGHNLIFKE